MHEIRIVRHEGSKHFPVTIQHASLLSTHTCLHAHACKQYKKQKLIRTNKACLNVRVRISVHTYTFSHTDDALIYSG